MKSVASNLLAKLSSSPPPKKLRKSTGNILLELLDHLEEIQKKNKFKNYTEDPDYVIGWIFDNKRGFNNENEFRAYSKCQLQLATDWLKKLVEKIQKKNKTSLTHRNIVKFKDHLISFLFEVKPFAEYFQKKSDPKYTFIWGVNTNYRQAWQIFQEAYNLYWSPVRGKGIGDYNISVNLATFALRQSLELKFRRILGVLEIYNSNFESPKIRHDFFPEFIQENLANFTTKYTSFRGLIKIYKWTNYHIHTGVVPRSWELEFALSYSNSLFKPSRPKNGQSWSIYDAVKISNYTCLIKSLSQKLTKTYDEHIWCINIDNPEALILSY